MDVFSPEELAILRNLPEVANPSGTIALPESIQNTLFEKWGLRLTHAPFRWVHGDTLPHVDVGKESFENTYLAYITDGEGTLEIGNETYPITAGKGFVFSRGTRHSVRDTRGSTRLMLGPMSESGVAVGAPSTVYIRQNEENQEYSGDQETWYAVHWPFNVYSGQTVLFVNELTLTDSNAFFICNGNYITFGSKSLNNDGTRSIINVDVDNYPGLVQNGDEEQVGYNNISIYNLLVGITNPEYRTVVGGGWIGQKGFGYQASSNYIVNCVSNGGIAQEGGGIVGRSAGVGGQLYVIGCVSSGTIEPYGGGIVGASAGGTGGSVTCSQCGSAGAIYLASGGIFGRYAGEYNGSASAIQCYSVGTIGDAAGGIFGVSAGANDNVLDSGGETVADRCFSFGNISADAGGIYALGAGVSGGTTLATNCYSAGTVASLTYGIYGIGKGNGTQPNCYVANDDWNDVDANAALLGVPTSGNVGNSWVRIDANIPYLLNNFGYTPYSTTIIDEASQFIQSYGQTVAVGAASDPGTAAMNYLLLTPTPGVSLDGLSGAITAASPGIYQLVILTGFGPFQYSVTTVTLTVPSPPTTSAEPRGKGYDFGIYNDTQIGKRLVQERLQNPNIRFNSFADYHKYKMALLRNNLR